MNTSATRWNIAMLPALILLASCATVVEQSTTDPAIAAPLAITIMTFNVQNLFDNNDDPGKDDKAYLPIDAKQNDAHINACNEIEVESWRDECLNLDWSNEALEHKLTVLANTIRQVNGGSGADIIALQEVENLRILERLRTEHLAGLGYRPAILIEGTDLRGIDVAFLSRMPLAQPPALHPLSLPDFPEREGDTRGVLQADFRLPDGSILSGFSVHFPAPFHPTEMRIAAYRHLTDLLEALPDSHHAFAAGDFNTTSVEDNEKKMLDTYARPHWMLAHDIGCEKCKGSHYYAKDDSWSFLDMILFSEARGKNTTARIRADSVRIANLHPPQVSDNGTPERYRSAQGTGVSDHWPLVATVELTQKQ
jgi:endonuclease/exonuclease/phosphatase family metal-dependent hydrolase